jgi:hypothetical protein
MRVSYVRFKLSRHNAVGSVTGGTYSKIIQLNSPLFYPTFVSQHIYGACGKLSFLEH